MERYSEHRKPPATSWYSGPTSFFWSSKCFCVSAETWSSTPSTNVQPTDTILPGAPCWIMHVFWSEAIERKKQKVQEEQASWFMAVQRRFDPPKQLVSDSNHSSMNLNMSCGHIWSCAPISSLKDTQRLWFCDCWRKEALRKRKEKKGRRRSEG